MAVMGIRKMRSCNFRTLLLLLVCTVNQVIDIISRVCGAQSHSPFGVMSQPQSPTSEHLSSPLDIHDDDTQQRSAISDTARQERLAALERRNRSTTHPHDDTAVAAEHEPQPFDANHNKRTEFRRLVDPGIMRPNSKEVALRSLRVNIKNISSPPRVD